jgi:hypothetical protein
MCEAKPSLSRRLVLGGIINARLQMATSSGVVFLSPEFPK